MAQSHLPYNFYRYCVVTPIKTDFSQTTSIPSCPTGYTSVWAGYSFAYGTVNGSGHVTGGGLTEIGSCLRHFRGMPLTECYRNGCEHQRDVGKGDNSSWLTTRNDVDSVSTTPENEKTHVSRCRVCRKN